MTFEQLYYFLVVAKLLNFTKASGVLHISQPTLSRQIALLEEELQVKLFYRNNRPIQLTSAGQLLVKEGSALLQQRDLLKAHLQQLVSGMQGTLCISSLYIYSETIAEATAAFCEKYPGINLSLHSKQTGDIENDILTGAADLGVCFDFELTNPVNISKQKVFQSGFCLIMSEKHPLSIRDEVSLEAVQNETLYFLGKNDFRFIADLWERANLSQAANANLYKPEDIESVLLQIRNGSGASIVPIPVAEVNKKGMATATIKNLDSTFNVVIIWNKTNFNPAVKLYLDTMNSLM